MSDFMTSSEIVSIEQELRKVDPSLLGDPAMIVAMAIRLDETEPTEGALRSHLATYVTFRWPQFRASVIKSLTKGELVGPLLQDIRRRTARRN